MKILLIITAVFLLSACAEIAIQERQINTNSHAPVSDKIISNQRDMLANNANGKGFGPQSPRDIDAALGSNNRIFSIAPVYVKMNLCNIHFHKNAEHKGGEFTKYAGNGNGNGYQTGYMYSGQLTAAELQPVKSEVCPNEHDNLDAGDTIEVHYVHSTAQVTPGPTLDSCLSSFTMNPQLRVETQVYVLVNDSNALDFGELTRHSVVNGFHRAMNIPNNTGVPVQYKGSTTGPVYNETSSPLEVTWSVRPKVSKVNIMTVSEWCKGNDFNEDHAHGVRNLVINPDFLSKKIKQ